MKHDWRTVLGIALLLLQLAGIGYARFSQLRYFCWAPYDEITLYHIDVVIRQQPLDAVEIHKRYRLSQTGRDNRSSAHVLRTIEQYEKTLGADDNARVTVTYSVNGGAEKRWHWPSDLARPPEPQNQK